MLRRLGIAVLVTVLAVLAYLLLWPVPIDPEAWTPPPDPGRPTERTLPTLEILASGGDRGPEDVEVDAEGRLYGGTEEGHILRWPVDGGPPEVFATTGGRPLGLHWDAAGNLLVADASAGLLSIAPDGTVSTLSTTCGDRPLSFADDLETDATGRIWFTEASVKFDQQEWKLDLLENGPNGRLCMHDPATGETTEVLRGLYFANGVAVDPAQQFVLVNETSRYRVRRLWIDGPRQGTDDVLVDGLPGFPDGISAGEGRFWIAIASPRNPILDTAAERPWLRSLLARLPEAIQPAPERYAHVRAIDASGATVAELVDPEGTEFSTVTSVQERDGTLYLGSLSFLGIARLPAPAARGR